MKERKDNERKLNPQNYTNVLYVVLSTHLRIHRAVYDFVAIEKDSYKNILQTASQQTTYGYFVPLLFTCRTML